MMKLPVLLFLASAHLAVAEGVTVFEQRPIPPGVLLQGHAAGAKKYGYRIPSLCVTKKGTVLAFTERRLGLHDHAQNDIVLKRSTDGGKTWGEEIVAVEDGMHSINDPLTVQLDSGRILLMHARFPYGRHARASGWIKQAELGYDDPDLNVLTFLSHSDDDGLTWSEPRDISRQVKHPHWVNANTPGQMIQLDKGPHKGRVLTALWGTIPGEKGRTWEICAAYSDDGGETWTRTPPLRDVSGKGYPNECQVAEAANGDIVLISRNQGGDTFRKKAISKDGGETWGTIDIDRGLPSVACMGSVIKGPAKDDGSWDLYASFPSHKGRKDGQIAVSDDHGKTWQIRKVVPGAFAYSALQLAPDGKHLLCLYEAGGYKSETLLTIPLAELERKRDERPNILFLCVDDWNDWVGCLGDESVKTPNMDRLAAMGTLFTNAHCAAPVCNPSRAAVMSGLRPFETGVYENGSPLQLALPEGRLTLPQYFRKHGYLSHGSGKIYHDQIGFNFPEDWDHYFLWDETYRTWAWECGYSRPPDPEPDPRPAAAITGRTKRNFDFAPLRCGDEAMPDFKSTSYAVEFLQRKHSRPFFLAAGQFRPHLPWFVPKKYFDLYPLDEIETPPVLEGDADDLPEIAKKRALDRASKHDELVKLGEWEKAIQGYKACISFSDAQIGRVLDALEAGPHRDNTIIVLWSDHGYHLGEKGHWHKRTLWERSTHVPLIVVAPGVTEPGSTCDNPVDLLSLYPTLVELARLPGVGGTSLVPMLKDPAARRDTVALCTHGRGNHAVRSRSHRYIRYEDGSEELYDHRTDPHEWHNLAGEDGSASVIEVLRKYLPTTEAKGAPDYYRGTALIRLARETYDWKTKSAAAGDPAYVNAAKLKGQAWKAAAAEGR